MTNPKLVLAVVIIIAAGILGILAYLAWRNRELISEFLLCSCLVSRPQPRETPAVPAVQVVHASYPQPMPSAPAPPPYPGPLYPPDQNKPPPYGYQNSGNLTELN